MLDCRKGYLSDSILHFLEMRFLVEMTRHYFGQQGLQNASSSKQDYAGSNSDDCDVDIAKSVVLVGRCLEEASKEGHDQACSEQPLHASLQHQEQLIKQVARSYFMSSLFLIELAPER